jgi:uncharacterized membrane protein YeaQ/YmgE (transglycosylase-associated protein family)
MTLTVSVIIAWLLIGLVVGGLARLLVPGRQHIGLILTIGIGIVAALLGGIITTAIIGVGHPVITFIVALMAAASTIESVQGRHVLAPGPPRPAGGRWRSPGMMAAS